MAEMLTAGEKIIQVHGRDILRTKYSFYLADTLAFLGILASKINILSNYDRYKKCCKL